MTDEITPRRKRVITSLFAVFVLAHFTVLATAHQHWPVMSFPMLSFNFEDGLSCTVAFAVPADETKPEFRLAPPQAGVAGITLCYVFGKIARFPEKNPHYDKFAAECGGSGDAVRACVSERLAVGGLQFLYARYEAKRKRDPKLPALRALRLYEMRFVPSPRIYDVASKQLRLEWLTGAQP